MSGIYIILFLQIESFEGIDYLVITSSIIHIGENSRGKTTHDDSFSVHLGIFLSVKFTETGLEVFDS